MEAFSEEPDRLYGELLRLCRQVVQVRPRADGPARHPPALVPVHACMRPGGARTAGVVTGGASRPCSTMRASQATQRNSTPTPSTAVRSARLPPVTKPRLPLCLRARSPANPQRGSAPTQRVGQAPLTRSRARGRDSPPMSGLPALHPPSLSPAACACVQTV